jgi:AraC-like DNA-binding protein
MTITEKAQNFLLTADLRCAKMRHCAAALGLSPDRLRRTLAAERANYSRMLEAERKRRCTEYIEKGGKLYGGAIARVCGYKTEKEACVMFKRWYGVGTSDARVSRRQA